VGGGGGDDGAEEDFAYGEELRFWRVSEKPFLGYSQRTWASKAPHGLMHSESGFVRPQARGPGVEFLVCDPTGVAQGTLPYPTPLPRLPPLSPSCTSAAAAGSKWTRRARCSVYEGTTDSERLTLEVATTAVSRTSSAKEVTQLRRTYCVHSPKEGSCLTPVRLSYGTATSHSALSHTCPRSHCV
jgi:hypothetical protein